MVEKRHLVLKRWFADNAEKAGRKFIDFGTDHSYPFYDSFEPTLMALDAIAQCVDSARSYPSLVRND